MGNRRKTLTEIEIEHTLLMAKYDLAAYDIANILNRSQQSVYRILQRYGVASRPAERTEEQHLEADRLRRGVEPVIEPEPVEPQPEPDEVSSDGEKTAITARYFDRLKRWAGHSHLGIPPPEPPSEGTYPEPEPVEPEPVAIGTPLELVEFVCKECGQEFHLTTDHIEWFEARGINVPKRCQPCRDRRREMHDGGGVIGPANLDELSALRRRLEDMERRAALWESTQSEIE